MVESGSPLPAAWFVSAHHEAESYLPLEPIPRDLIAGPSSGRGGGREGALSDPLAALATLSPMTALADPFSKVHPLFWPVLWWSLRAFTAWTGKLIEAGHGYAGLSIHITWYGWVHVTHLDLSPERAAFNRHMMGVEDDGWCGVLAKAGRAVESLLAAQPGTLPTRHAAGVRRSSPACGGGARRAVGACGVRHPCGRSPPSTFACGEAHFPRRRGKMRPL